MHINLVYFLSETNNVKHCSQMAWDNANANSKNKLTAENINMKIIFDENLDYFMSIHYSQDQ